MNNVERKLVESVIVLLDGKNRTKATELAIGMLQEALKVRTALTVCEHCLKIGGCEHVQSSKA
jgi:hypothetical protein